MAVVCVRRAFRFRRKLSKPNATWGVATGRCRGDCSAAVARVCIGVRGRRQRVHPRDSPGAARVYANLRGLSGGASDKASRAACSGRGRPDKSGQVRTSPARPWSRRCSGLPAFSESGCTLDIIPFEPEPTDGARLHALRRRLGDTSCKLRGHATAIVSRAVPWRISVRRVDACNPAARSDRAIGSARRATRSQTCSPRLRRHLARDELRLKALQQRLQPRPLLGFGHEVAVRTRADQAHG